VTAQQQSTIQRSVLSARNAPRVNVSTINFAVNPGVVVPRRFNVVSVAAFPALIDAFPYYRDDSFFVVEDEVVFLDRERRVVDVVPVGPRTRFSHRGGGGGGGSVAMMDLNPQQIREVQQVLIDRGLLVGEADGVWGSRTREALITFQRQEGITTSGSVDTRTVTALGLSDRIGQGAGASSTVGQSRTQQNTTGQTTDQTNAPQNQSTGRTDTQQPAQQNTTGQTTGQANSPQNQSTTSQSGNQPSAQQQAPQQNTTGQAAPQNQSTVGQGSGNQPNAGRDAQPSQPNQNNIPPSSGSGQSPQTPAQNSDRK
jgi:peptidoglycan hydrolase-like protein with peptidoglycan-binding domain